MLSYNNGDITSIPKVSGTYGIGPNVTGMPFSGGCLAQVASDGYSVAITVWFGNTQYIRVGSGEVWDDWDILATATLPKEYDLSLTGATGTCKYSLDQFGAVRITGLITRDGGTAYFGTLPEGYRPVNQAIFACCGFTDGNTVSPCTVGVDPDGRVWVNDFGGGFKKVPVNMYFLAASSLL